MTGVRIYDPANSITYVHPDSRTDLSVRFLNRSQYPPPVLPNGARYPQT